MDSFSPNCRSGDSLGVRVVLGPASAMRSRVAVDVRRHEVVSLRITLSIRRARVSGRFAASIPRMSSLR